ncbi:MFS transporter [Actinacidiphila rubida]|uniref:MFS transporter n=1 Tax=Actinacidiphila rubida TaxID=310780 RepID=UPI0009452216
MPKVVWLLAAGSFANMVVAYTFVYLVLYLTGPRGLPVAQAGLIAGLGGAGLVAGNFTGGWFGDRYGHRRTLVAAAAVSGTGLMCLPLLPVAGLLLVLPAAQYAAGAVRASNSALVAVSVPAGARRQGYAVMRFASNAGFTLGPPLGALLAAHFSYGWLFVADGAGTLAFAAYASRILPARGTRRAEPAGRGAGPAGAASRAPGRLAAELRARPAVAALLAALVVTDTVYRQQYSTLPVYLTDHGFSTAFYGGLLAVNGGVILCLEIPVTLALRRAPGLRIITAGLALVGLGYAALLPGATVGTALALMLLLTAGEILYKTPATAYVADHSPPGMEGRFQSLYAGASVSGTVLAPPLGAALYSAAPSALWPTCAALAAAAALGLLAVHARGGAAAVPDTADTPAGPVPAPSTGPVADPRPGPDPASERTVT